MPKIWQRLETRGLKVKKQPEGVGHNLKLPICNPVVSRANCRAWNRA